MKKNKILLAFLIFGFTFGNLFAKEFNLTVIDKEIEIPLEGVVISVSSLEQTWETDENGEVLVSISDDVFDSQNSLTLTAYMPGYAKSNIRINSDTEDFTIYLSIEEVLEGKELVVEQEAYQETDAQTGISVVITKDQFDTASMIGAIPDVMTAVKTLPGVTYMGSFSQQPSIRGAYPYEMAAVLDGMYVYSPFHWNGAVSIFDPQFIQSIKLSHGIFSAKYGHATSGLLDITTVTPEDESIKFNVSVSDVITDGVLQVPVTQKLGFITGYRVSYYDTIPWLLDNTGLTKLVMKQYAKMEGDVLTEKELEYFKNFQITDYIKMPNMQDIYGKIYFNPTDRLHITLNEFYGHEGIGFNLNTVENESIDTPQVETNTNSYFDETLYKYYSSTLLTNIAWKNVFHFGSINFQILPTDKLQINARAGYNAYTKAAIMKYTSTYDISKETHTINYISDDSDEEYDSKSQEPYDKSKLKTEEKYFYYNSIDNSTIYYENSYKISVLQGKVSADFSPDSTNIFSLGAEEFYKKRTSYRTFDYTTYNYSDSYYEGESHEPSEETEYYSLSTTPVEGNQVLNSVAYTTWEFGDSNSLLQGEAGFRFEHYYVYNKAPNTRKKVSLSSVPTWNPRISVSLKPKKNLKSIEDLTFTSGIGMFSELNDDTMKLTSDYEIIGEKFLPDQNIFTIAGCSFSFLDNFKFQLEGYYKYYLNRFYSVGYLTNQNIIERLLQQLNGLTDDDFINKAFFDGKGHVFGFDSMLQKKTGRYFDGYLCYSFIVAKYLNPFQPTVTDDETEIFTDNDDPLGYWYYPYFHRFHTFSMVLNYRPTDSLVLTLTGSVCSGVPVSKNSLWTQMFGNTIAEKNRTSVSFPINFRIGKSGYFKTTKIQYEWYSGIENILGFLNKDSLLGAAHYLNTHQDYDNMYIYAERLSNFDVGAPIFTIGLRLSM